MVLVLILGLAASGCRKHGSDDGQDSGDPAVSAGSGGSGGGSPTPGSTGGTTALVLSDDFSIPAVSSRWISTVPTEIFVDAPAGQVSWKANRLHPQMLYRPIPTVSGNFHLEARIYIEYAANNCHILVGMSATEKPTLTSIPGGLGGGIYMRAAWHGGGVPNHYYFTSIFTEDAANVPFTPWEHDDFGSGPTAGATVISTGTWYRIILKREGAAVTLLTELDDHTPVGFVTCAAPAGIPDLKYVWIGKNDTGDWPWMTGWLDDVAIYRLP